MSLIVPSDATIIGDTTPEKTTPRKEIGAAKNNPITNNIIENINGVNTTVKFFMNRRLRQGCIYFFPT